MVSILVWISPWASIMLVDYFVIRHGRLDVASLYQPVETSAYGRFNVAGLVSLAAGVAAGWRGSTGWFPRCRGRWPLHWATPTSPGCQAVSLPEGCTSAWPARPGPERHCG
jgi:cytosine/uracil/thiamine/allantoin permease